MKLKTKPRITTAIHNIHKSILVENSLFIRYTKLKDPETEAHDKYQYSRNLLLTVTKKNKKQKIEMNFLKIT